ncbi:MAG: hypothetical protein C5B54_00270 [Acidobacteria bacterium]|nr:MAG: hypothetical protein C5B54_00270 [Acidobacteriota bacterium]
MRKMLTLTLIGAIIAPLLFAAYPDEYPLYLRLMGFSKEEIRDLEDGGMVQHTLKDKLPGEYGTIVGVVSNVPVYYYRDYYRYIENFKSLFEFQQIGKFGSKPDLQDLKALRFTDKELEEFLTCQQGNCEIKLSADEIAMIPKNPDMKTDAGKERISDVYRQIILNRLLAYQGQGMKGLKDYVDGPTPYNLNDILQNHMLKFSELDAYFPIIKKYILEYPTYKNKRIEEFFFWSKEFLGNKPVIGLRHVFTERIGEDYIIVTKLIYANHYMLSSIAITHLLDYVDKGVPRTLLAVEQRTLTDLRGDPWEAFGRSIMRSNQTKRIAMEYKAARSEMELRYLGREYTSFPYGLLPRDQR